MCIGGKEGLKMSDDDVVDESQTPSLDYDMWEGQFEFVGPKNAGVKPVEHLSANVNGGKRNAAHVWAEEVIDHVICFSSV